MNKIARLLTPLKALRPKRLQWRLTLSYTLVSAGALLVVELLLFAVLFAFLGSNLLTNVMVQAVQNQLVPQAREFLIQSPPDIEGLQEWTANLINVTTQISPQGIEEETTLQVGNVRLNSPGQQLYVVAPDLTVLATVPKPSDQLDDLLNIALVQTAVAEAQEGATSTQQNSAGNRIIAAPIMTEDDSLVGIILLTYDLPLLAPDLILPLLQVIGFTLIPFTLATAVVGTIFGFLTARGLTRRIEAMSTAADAWSQGDFSVVAGDETSANSGDELAELGRRLNLMAEQLQNLLDARQELATLEERNRLARDLHDSVKQQVFAITMQLGAARSLIDNDPNKAANHLQEAEQLAQQSQQELAGLIQALRPSALGNRGLVEALETFVDDWSRRTMITAHFQTQGERPLPLPVEQALFRVAQEALANVARHSQARQVKAQLHWQENLVSLTVSDDGQGFHIENEANSGMGLSSMSERMVAVGGQLTVTSKHGEGTTIVAVCDLRNQEL